MEVIKTDIDGVVIIEPVFLTMRAGTSLKAITSVNSTKKFAR